MILKQIARAVGTEMIAVMYILLPALGEPFLNANVRPVALTSYQWVRVESPSNPKFSSTVSVPSRLHAATLPDNMSGSPLDRSASACGEGQTGRPVGGRLMMD
jgi:hypothetical protein